MCVEASCSAAYLHHTCAVCIKIVSRHSSIRYLRPLILLRVTGAGAGPSGLWATVEFSLDERLVHHQADTQRQTTTDAHIHTYRQFRFNE